MGSSKSSPRFKNALRRAAIFLPVLLIKGYKLIVSPWLPSACRFTPTCSQYALEALRKHGLLRGSYLATRRILRCHPWGGHGHDPVPD
ncbi:MAG: membrane protein insertion efficiency factor YidD [Rikenellaceae bacterium]|nr:membrane protein insertion efficiency factor YidD [Rikenellaceae bacterium]